MDTLFRIIVVLQVLSALVIIGLVLLQHGKGADMGAAFGSGASGSLFGATGSSNFVSKSTGVAAAIFFACTLALSYIASNRHATAGSNSVMDSLPAAAANASAKASAAGSALAAKASAGASAAGTVAPSPAPANQVPK
jgi:preprotein translocase subunit SecG